MSQQSRKRTNRNKRASGKRARSATAGEKFHLPALSLSQMSMWTSRALLGGVALGAVGGAVFGIAPLRNRVAHLRTDPLVVTFDWPRLAGAGNADSTWMNVQERDRLGSIALAHLTPDPFDRESLVAAQVALTNTGWFAESPTVRRQPGGLIEISGDWRTPAAVVRRDGWEWLVSRDGTLLPVRYPIGAAGALPVIVGVYAGEPRRSDGSPALGAVWAGGDAPAAISLFDILRQSEHMNEVAHIDVSGYVRDGLLTIVTQDEARIVWGSPPGSEAPGEVPDAVKLERFDRLFADPTWIGQGRPPIEIHTAQVLIDESARP